MPPTRASRAKSQAKNESVPGKRKTPKSEASISDFFIPSKKESTDEVILIKDEPITIEPDKTQAKTKINSEDKPSGASGANVSAYELQRQENIRRNQEMLLNLDLGGARGISANTVLPVPKTKKPVKRVYREKPPVISRSSRRIKGEKPEALSLNLLKKNNLHGYLHEEIEDQSNQDGTQEPTTTINQTRVTVKPDSAFNAAPEFASMVTNLSQTTAKPEVLGALTAIEVEQMTEQSLVQRIQRLQCVTHGATKLTYDRIYSMAIHPDPSKLLVAAGSKVGELSLWDASLYAEEWRSGTPGLASAEVFDPSSSIFRFQPHFHAVTGIRFHPAGYSKMVTSSHDGTIRLLDMENQEIVSALTGTEGSISLTSLDFASDQPHVAFFSTYSGDVGFHDLRTTGLLEPTAIYNLNPKRKKIGCLALNPVRPHLLATASNDRSVKVWDIRNMSSSAKSACQMSFPFSVNSAHWDPTGSQLVTAGFEHALRVIDASALEAGVELPLISKTPHNCRTGKYVTLLQARFHPDPLIGNRVVTVADMKRGVDFYSARTGSPLVKFTDLSVITAIPAVLAYHPLATLSGSSPVGSTLACGNASGYAFILM